MLRELGAALSTVLAVVIASCSSSSADSTNPHDAGSDTLGDASDASDDWQPPPLDSGPTIRCTLDNGSDPVALCTQKDLLRFLHEAAWLPAVGVAESWDSKTFAVDADDAGAPRHDLADDAAYAAACARYHSSSKRYGDDELLGQVDADLTALADVLTAELTSLPARADGELYLHLRRAAVGLRVIDQNAKADTLDARTDAYGQALFDQWFHPLSGADGGNDDGVVGELAGAAVSYRPEQAAAVALAFADLAARRLGADAAGAAPLEQAAVLTVAHLLARARDPKTGLFYRALVTSADPDHDALLDLADGLPSDLVSSDVQALVGLSLSRIAEVAAGPPLLSNLDALALDARADDVLAAVRATSVPLWDTNDRGFVLGWSPASAALIDWKSTRSNAFLLALVHRSNVRGNAKFAADQAPLRSLLIDRKPLHSSLFSSIASQQGYFRAVPSSYDFANTDASAPFDHETSYFANAISDACEALDEMWLGLP